MKDSKVIKFPQKDQDYKETMKLLKVSDQLDQIIIENIESGKLSMNEIAGLLAHRLGSLVRMSEQKQDLLQVCLSVISRQADARSE